MENDLFETEVTFWGKHVAETLGIAPVTLRKWSAELEKQGWEFSKDEQQRRAYTQQDYVALRYLHDLMRDKRTSLEKAVGQVVKRYKNAVETLDLPEYRRPDIGERTPAIDEQIKLLAAQQMDFMERQEEFNRQLLQRLEQQEQYIEERLKARDEKLTQTMNLVLETKQLLAAAQQPERKKWYQFWK
ncbi:DUF3967 domain-containing protein [Brevibacillus migulae]|uniref:DUF3967 domain-containing protein n=1 Tax=Brevibacillus migulae TaxID=1644114 RepID=UPI00106E321E|nr:DUF3967 domain-containing protein [Brevibacillus migulae]